MSQRYRKFVSTLMRSDPEIFSPYGTRNKRRKLDEIISTIPRVSSSVVVSLHPQSVKSSTERSESRNQSIYSRNLGNALKSILSESPRRRNSIGGDPQSRASIEVSPSVDEDRMLSAGATVTVAPHTSRGQTSSTSVSSPSRETTPSSSLGGTSTVDIPPFIEFFQNECERGNVSPEVKEEALKMLHEWRTEWLSETKRVRQLKRQIKAINSNQAQRDSSPVPSTTTKHRKGSKLRATVVESLKPSETEMRTPVEPKSPKSDSPQESHSPGRKRKQSIAGPNGLTGNYWNEPTDEMGRGNRRKSKV
jgi:hypothetical protein